MLLGSMAARMDWLAGLAGLAPGVGKLPGLLDSSFASWLVARLAELAGLAMPPDEIPMNFLCSIPLAWLGRLG